MVRILTILILIFNGIACYSQVQQTASQQLADRIAQKMKDSLSLSNQARDEVYAINMELHNQKMAVRQQYSQHDLLQVHIQRIENSRDSLYRNVLTAEQYMLYRQKKRNLVTNN